MRVNVYDNDTGEMVGKSYYIDEAFEHFLAHEPNDAKHAETLNILRKDGRCWLSAQFCLFAIPER